MQVDLANELSGLRHLIISILKSQSQDERRNASEIEAIQLLRSRFDTRFDRLESEISLIRSESKAILKKLESLNNFAYSGENLKEFMTNEGAKRSSKSDNHSQVMNGKEKTAISTSRTSLLAEKCEFSSIDDRGACQNEEFQNAIRTGRFSLSADIVLDSSVSDSQHGLSPVITPSGPIGSESDFTNTVPNRGKVRVNSANVNRFKSLRDHVEHTKPESESDTDSDDEGHHGSVLSSAFSCLKAVARCKWRQTIRRVFGITKPDIFANEPGSQAIHPASPFMAVVECMSASLLVYCIGVVPVQLSFWCNIGACQRVPTMEFDMFVDLFFMLEVLIRFFVGIWINGRYCDDYRTIAWVYLTAIRGFWFDALTSIPLSWVDYEVYKNCQRDTGNSDSAAASASSQNAQFLRVVKTLRLFKLGRLLKVFKLFSIVEERLDLTAANMRLFKIFFALGACMHLYACAYWRVKIETLPKNEIDLFLSSKNADGDYDGQIYIVCLYFICTVFTTIGFGDISAFNHAERIFCIFMMCSAACFFGVILSELQEIYVSNNSRGRELSQHIESVVNFLKENRVPTKVEKQIKSWIRFQYVQQKADEQLLLRMRTMFYTAGSSIARRGETADCLAIIISGKVRIYLPGRPGAPLLVLGPGASMGDNSVLGDERWGGVYGIDIELVAEENCKVCYILATDIQDVVYSSPAYLMIRRLFSSFSFCSEPADADQRQTPLAVNEAVQALDRDGLLHVRSYTGKQEQSRQRAIFHLIRFARTYLHSLRVQPTRKKTIGSTRRLKSSCQEIPTIVPSRSASSRHIPADMSM